METLRRIKVAEEKSYALYVLGFADTDIKRTTKYQSDHLHHPTDHLFNSLLACRISDNKEVFTFEYIGASTVICSEKNVGVASPPPFPCVAMLGGHCQ